MDLGCAGGQLALDFLSRGHIGVGLEGSDYSAKIGRVGWKDFYNKNLFTCDLTHEYSVLKDGELLLFDCITSWEVLEHIAKWDLPQFMSNIVRHMKPDGIFCASVTSYPDYFGLMEPPYTPEIDKPLHQTVIPYDQWRAEILSPFFDFIEPYPFRSHVRADVNPPFSAWFVAKKK
jgi:cyclopropane fatty-acyl-phospholipid synthase-like methyltransferase